MRPTTRRPAPAGGASAAPAPWRLDTALRDAALATSGPSGLAIGSEMMHRTSAQVNAAKVKGEVAVLKRVPTHDVPWVRTNGPPRPRTLLGAPAAAVELITETEDAARAVAPSLWWSAKLTSARAPSRLGWIAKPLDTPKDGATTLLLANEFLTEVGVAGVIAHRVLPVCPHFVRTAAAWVQRGAAHILMEHGGVALESVVGDMSIADVQSVVMQVLAALACGESLAAFKHHDLHLDNVFVTRSKRERELHRYDLLDDGGKPFSIMVPVDRWFARVADYGLAAATDLASGLRVGRADYHLSDMRLAKWGQWSPDLEGHEVYDSFYFATQLKNCKYVTKDCDGWARQLLAAVETMLPSGLGHVTSADRPWINSVAGCSVRQLLATHPLFAPFRADPPATVKFVRHNVVEAAERLMSARAAALAVPTAASTAAAAHVAGGASGSVTSPPTAATPQPRTSGDFSKDTPDWFVVSPLFMEKKRKRNSKSDAEMSCEGTPKTGNSSSGSGSSGRSGTDGTPIGTDDEDEEDDMLA